MTSLTDISTADLAAALTTDVDFNLELPDPEDDQLHDAEFDTQIERVWQICDRFDLQTDIWRGRIMRAVRDREKRGGDGRGTGFLNWLKQREISKSQAYGLIELANSADTLLAEVKMLSSKRRNRPPKFKNSSPMPPKKAIALPDGK